MDVARIPYREIVSGAHQYTQIPQQQSRIVSTVKIFFSPPSHCPVYIGTHSFASIIYKCPIVPPPVYLTQVNVTLTKRLHPYSHIFRPLYSQTVPDKKILHAGTHLVTGRGCQKQQGVFTLEGQGHQHSQLHLRKCHPHILLHPRS